MTPEENLHPEDAAASVNEPAVAVIPKKKRKLKLIEVAIETPTVSVATDAATKKAKLDAISSQIEAEFGAGGTKVSPKRRKLMDPEVHKEILDKRRKEKIAELLSIEPSECHFCFNNPKVADHMLISIAENSYLTLAKGPVSVAQNGLKFPGHVIITPIEHKPQLSTFISDDDAASDITESPVYKELAAYEASLCKMYAGFDMGTVFFDFNTPNGVHYHIQAVPVPVKYLQKVGIAIDRQFKYHGKKFGEDVLSPFQKFVREDDEEYVKIMNDRNVSFIKFKVVNSRGKCEIHVSTFDPAKRVDMQFGRSVLAYVLNQPKRHFWNNEECQESVAEEKSHVEHFQVAYNGFDVAGGGE